MSSNLPKAIVITALTFGLQVYTRGSCRSYPYYNIHELRCAARDVCVTWNGAYIVYLLGSGIGSLLNCDDSRQVLELPME